jgi:predicted acylesterase/phospholipase RssA
VYSELCGRAPASWIRPAWTPWLGAFHLDEVRRHLRDRVPADFSHLMRSFGVGVAEGGQAHLLTEGNLPDAIAASCAVPYLFQPVVIDGRAFIDGGAVDRTAIEAWRRQRPGRTLLLHLMEASMAEPKETPQADVVVRSPRSGAHLWSLGDHRARFDRTRAATRAALEHAISEGIVQTL